MRSLISLVGVVVILGLSVPLLKRLHLETNGQTSAPANVDSGTITAQRTRRPARSSSAADNPDPIVSWVTLYRWRGRNGTLHIQTEPPPPGVKAEIISIRRELPAQNGSPKAGSSENQLGRASTDLQSPLSVYAPGGVDKLLDQLDQTLEGLRRRKELVDEVSRDL